MTKGQNHDAHPAKAKLRRRVSPGISRHSGHLGAELHDRRGRVRAGGSDRLLVRVEERVAFSAADRLGADRNPVGAPDVQRAPNYLPDEMWSFGSRPAPVPISSAPLRRSPLAEASTITWKSFLARILDSPGTTSKSGPRFMRPALRSRRRKRGNPGHLRRGKVQVHAAVFRGAVREPEYILHHDRRRGGARQVGPERVSDRHRPGLPVHRVPAGQAPATS